MLTCATKQYLQDQAGFELTDHQAILAIRLILAHLDDDVHSRGCHRAQVAREWKGRHMRDVDAMASEIADVSPVERERLRDSLFMILELAL